MKLNNMLNSISSYPFHMPGHKRNTDFEILGSEIDITEINGFDNLHNPKGVIKEIEDDFTRLYHSEKSIISVNGSTCCILASIFALCEYGDKIIIARNCHKSVYNACFIRRLNVVYAEPEFDNEYGIYTKVDKEKLNNLITKNPDAKAVVLTSPTYEGITSEIKCDIPLIIDAAHGGHFGFSDIFPKRTTGDIVINSLHKTLPCLTQTAIVHIYNKHFCKAVKKYMDIFETSSPSYILLASCEKCVDFLKNSEMVFLKYKNILNNFYAEAKKLNSIQIMKNDDISRIIIKANGYSGKELTSILRSNGIEPEGFGLEYVILISTVCDTCKGFELLLDALKTINRLTNSVNTCTVSPLPIPRKACEAHCVNSVKETELNYAEGMVCGEYIYAYPPGVPIIIPGEIISKEIISCILKMKENGINIISDGNLKDNIILTKSS